MAKKSGASANGGEKKAQKARGPHVSAERFVEVWQGSASLAEAAAAMGKTEQGCGVRASMIRKKGVPLKRFGGGGRVDWKALAEKATRLVGGEVPEAVEVLKQVAEAESELL